MQFGNQVYHNAADGELFMIGIDPMMPTVRIPCDRAGLQRLYERALKGFLMMPPDPVLANTARAALHTLETAHSDVDSGKVQLNSFPDLESYLRDHISIMRRNHGPGGSTP